MVHRNHSLRHQARKGVGTLLFMFCLVVFIVLLMLVVNYTYLAHSQLRISEVIDTLNRTTVAELLDEDRLNPAPTIDQTADKAAVEALIDIYNDQMNLAAGANQQLRYVIGSNNPANTDIFVEFGRVDDVTQPITDSGATPTFDTTPAPGEPLNTLKIVGSRQRTSGNPLYWLVRFNTNQAADAEAASFVTLDSRVVGFQPTTTVNTPIVPIGISNVAWPIRPISVGGTARFDFQGRLRDTGSVVPGNLVLLNFDENAAGIDTNAIGDQIVDGTSQNDINIDGDTFLGPVVEGTPVTLTLPADDETPLGPVALALVADLITAKNSADPRRIFPLYSSYSDASGEAVIVGFVSAKVIGASYDVPNQRLNLALEPEFVVHFTAVTERQHIDGMNTYNVPENVYVHKLRLSR